MTFIDNNNFIEFDKKKDKVTKKITKSPFFYDSHEIPICIISNQIFNHLIIKSLFCLILGKSISQRFEVYNFNSDFRENKSSHI